MFYRFADPHILWLLFLLPLMALLQWRARGRQGTSLRFSSLGLVEEAGVVSKNWIRHIPFALRLLVIGCLVLALARPQTGVRGEEVTTEGIDIMLVLDLSSSMLAEDIKPNRVEAAKQVEAEFVRGRRNDRVGLVVFAGLAFTQAPLTLDYDIVLDSLARARTGLIEDGTAMGMGLATAIKRLRASQAESKVIVLVTDGRNNSGEIDPLMAADMAAAFGIRIYTIGAGGRGEALYPVDDPLRGRRYVRVRVDIDEETLGRIAEKTEGRYFRATDRQSLETIYQEIDRLEKTEIEVEEFTRYGELFIYPLLLGVLFLIAEVLLAQGPLRKLP